jgi:DNA-binding protein HU-beta
MTKMDIVKGLAKAEIDGVSLTQDSAKDVLNTIIDLITEGLKTDGIVQITGFGTYKCKEVAAREGHNPKNPAEKIMIAAHNQVSFTSGAQLKADVNVKKKVASKPVAKAKTKAAVTSTKKTIKKKKK